jgi:hypothetical protein
VCVSVKGVVEDARSGTLMGGEVSWGAVCTVDVVELRNADGVSGRVGLGEHEVDMVNLVNLVNAETTYGSRGQVMQKWTQTISTDNKVVNTAYSTWQKTALVERVRTSVEGAEDQANLPRNPPTTSL